MGRFHYKRFFLFLVALIPSIVIALLGWRNAGQDRELEAKRFDEERNTTRERTRQQVRHQLLALLEDIKSAGSAAAVRADTVKSASANPAVKLVAFADGNRLLLPWEANPNVERFRQSIEEKEFAMKVAEAERFEFVAPVDYLSAEAIYSGLVSSAEAAGNSSQAAYARVRLARTLAKSGKLAQALPIYLQLLILPSSAVDDQGIPFTLLGASGLSEMHNADREVLDRMALELESSTALTTAWHSSLTGVLEGLKRSRDASVGRDAEQALKQSAARGAYLEQARALQNDFPTLHVTPTDWLPYGKDTWLVGMTAPKAESKPSVIAVRAEDVFKEIESRSDAELRFAIAAGDVGGEPLGENLPGLRLSFRTAGYYDFVRSAGRFAVIPGCV